MGLRAVLLEALKVPLGDVSTDADAVDTSADVVDTSADVVGTSADVFGTNADVVDTDETLRASLTFRACPFCTV